ncbi:MAG TPA: hypothetical protein VM513_18175 [Kofleriaceae bacterium]|nr:hypothetical protein [Kofleriaceae bacterium]
MAAALAPAFTAAGVSRALGAPPVAVIVTRALGLDDDAAPLIERVLVVLADH